MLMFNLIIDTYHYIVSLIEIWIIIDAESENAPSRILLYAV